MSCSSDFEDEPFVFLNEDFGFENGESFPKDAVRYFRGGGGRCWGCFSWGSIGTGGLGGLMARGGGTGALSACGTFGLTVGTVPKELRDDDSLDLRSKPDTASRYSVICSATSRCKSSGRQLKTSSSMPGGQVNWDFPSERCALSLN